jgi:hypothetical protein
MNDPRAKVLEEQLDTIAGKVKRLEEQITAVVDVLTRHDNSEALHVTLAELRRLKCPTSAAAGTYEHASERDTRVRNVVRESEIDRLLAERRRQDRDTTQDG